MHEASQAGCIKASGDPGEFFSGPKWDFPRALRRVVEGFFTSILGGSWGLSKLGLDMT